jgi:hypothetical protein
LIKSSIKNQNGTSKQEILDFLNLLRPVKTEFKLVRIGGGGDGGYLVPEVLENIDFAFSPGVAGTATFELDLINMGIPCFLADYSVNSAPVSGKDIDFEKKYIGAEDSEIFMTLDSWLQKKNVLSKSLLLQMDIEGGEWEVLETLSRETLSKFKVLVIEFHGLEQIFLRFSYTRISKIFKKLFEDFHVVHFHPNNNDPIFSHFGISIPPTAEITFLRRDLVGHTSQVSKFTSNLDIHNSDWKPKIFAEQTFKTH